MGKEYSPPGTVRLTAELRRLEKALAEDPENEDNSTSKAKKPEVSVLPRKRVRSGLLDLKPWEPPEAAAHIGRQIDSRNRQLKAFAPLRKSLAQGERRGWWWFYDFNGQTEAIPPHWWNSAAAEDAASHGVVTIMRAIGASVHSLKAVLVVDEAKLHTSSVTVPSKSNDETRAIKYIVGLMKESPEKPAGMKNEKLFADVKRHVPGLSRRAFERAKAAAIEETGAVDWEAPGR